jgi:hypothetical protein
VGRLRAACMLAAALMLGAVPLRAASLPAASLPDSPLFAEVLPQARLAGQGDFRWFGMRIYEARFWVGAQGYSASAPMAAPFVLELRYALGLQGRRIADASAEQMRDVGAGSVAQRQVWLTVMRGLFPDVKEGDRIAGQFTPGQGVRFYFNGVPLGQAQDAEFAQAFFSIWLSPKTSAPDLRAALLRQAAPVP